MPISRFPLLAQFARDPSALGRALQTIALGQESRSIRNVQYQDAKAVLSGAFYKAWHKHVMEAHLYEALRHGPMDEATEVIYDLSVLSLHDAIAARKRVDRLDPEHPAAAAAQALLAEAQPLAVAVKDLKAHVVKGREAPAAPTQPENPDKVMGSCPCCFRGIAVLQTTGNMAHHGYRRPAAGFQSASCPGIRFKPLEESTAGLEWMIRVCNDRLVQQRARAAAAPSVSQIQIRRTSRSALETVTPADPNWQRVLAQHIRGCESEVKSSEFTIAHLEESLGKWQAYHEEKSGQAARPARERPRQ